MAPAALINRARELNQDPGIKIIYAINRNAGRAIVGHEKPGPVPVHSMQGKTIAVARCDWTGVVTTQPERKPEQAISSPTQVVEHFVRSKAAGMRMFCGKPSSDTADQAVKKKTLYLVPIGLGSKRRAAYLAGHVDLFVAVTPQEVAMADDGQGYIYMYPADEPPFPESPITVSDATWNQPGFQDTIYPALKKTLQEARKAFLADPDGSAQWLLEYASRERGTISAIKTLAQAQEAVKIAAADWSPTGCFDKVAYDDFFNIPKDYTGYYAPEAVCK